MISSHSATELQLEPTEVSSLYSMLSSREKMADLLVWKAILRYGMNHFSLLNLLLYFIKIASRAWLLKFLDMISW